MAKRFPVPKLLVAALFATYAGFAAAQDGVDTFGPFRLVAGQPGVVVLDGPIEFGTGTEFLRASYATAEPPLKLLLNSDGGSVEDALLIADAVRMMRIETEIPEGSTCQSACVLIFFAGVGRTAIGTLGVHRFTLMQDGLAPVENPTVTVASQGLLLRFGASQALVDLAWATPPETMHILTADEVAAFGVNRTREEGLRLAEAEDYPPLPEDTETTLDPFEAVGDFGPGVTMTIRRSGVPDETHVGATKWEVAERQGIVRVSVAIPDLNFAYTLVLGPFTTAGLPYLFGGFAISAVGADGPAPLGGMFVSLAAGYAVEGAGDEFRLVRFGYVALDRTEFYVSAGLPRLALDIAVDRLERATTMQFIFSLDGTTDNVTFVDFDLTENGRAALARALPAWTTD